MESAISSISEIIEVGEGTRVEIDLIDSLSEKEGILVGDTARGFILVLAETRETPTYPARPFRINAGAIHQYVCVENGETRYLSELKAGDKVLVTDGTENRYVSIGRVKIEKREFVHVALENGVTATLQKADSVFVAGDNKAIHFLDIKAGDSLVTFPNDCIARHKGKIIEEEIVEK